MTIKIRVHWENASEIETAQQVTNTIDSILEGKQKRLGIIKAGIRTVNDPQKSFGINVETCMTVDAIIKGMIKDVGHSYRENP